MRKQRGEGERQGAKKDNWRDGYEVGMREGEMERRRGRRGR